MPAKKSTNKTTSKPRTSKKAKTMKPQLKIWIGVLIVLIVAIIGLVVVRFSEASPRRGSRDVWIGLNKVANPGKFVGWKEYIDPTGNVQYLQLSINNDSYAASRGSGTQVCYVAFTNNGARTFNAKYLDGVGPGQYAQYRSPYCPSGGRVIGSGVN